MKKTSLSSTAQPCVKEPPIKRIFSSLVLYPLKRLPSLRFVKIVFFPFFDHGLKVYIPGFGFHPKI